MGTFEDVLYNGCEWPGSAEDVDEIAAWHERIAQSWQLADEIDANLRELGAELARVEGAAEA